MSAARHRRTVLLVGPSGAGKTHAAEKIHAASGARGRFVVGEGARSTRRSGARPRSAPASRPRSPRRSGRAAAIPAAPPAYCWIKVGGVIINDYPSFRVENMPYGGVKDSGVGREGLRYAIEEMTELKLMVVNLKNYS